MAVPDLQDAINHLQQKDLDAAIQSLEHKIDDLPAHLTAHVLLARAYEAKREWDLALKCWENVRFLMPNSPVGREGKQRVLRHLQGLDEPASTADDAPSERPSSEETASQDAPSDATPTDESSAEAPEAADASSEDEESEDDSPTTATEAVSELEQLRRQAEAEARQGGARAGLAATADPETPSSSEESVDTTQDRADQLEEEGDDEDDLDRLIDELESARIEPRPDVDDIPPPDLENDVDDIVSETLARIHEAQDQYRKAAQIYVKLASQEPDEARAHLQKAAEMREKAEQKAEQENSE